MNTYAVDPADSPRAQSLLERLVDKPINRNLQAALNRSSMSSKQMYAVLGVVQHVVRMGVPLSPTIFRKARTIARKLLKNQRFWNCLGGETHYSTVQALEQWLTAQIPARGAGRTPIVGQVFQAPRPQAMPAPRPTRGTPQVPRRAASQRAAPTADESFDLGALRPHASTYAGPMSDENFELGPLQPREQDDDDKPPVAWGARD